MMLTYGEAYTAVKLSLHMEDGKFKTIPIPSSADKMNRRDAAKYYNSKCRDVFEKLGYKYEEKKSSLYPHSEWTEPYYVSTPDGFDSVDDYYDYHETSKLVKMFRCADVGMVISKVA